MKNYISDRIYLCKQDLTETQIEDLKSLSSGKNPAYSLYQKMISTKPWLGRSKKFPEPPKTIELYTETATELILPKGLYKQIPIDLTDCTCKVPAKFTFTKTLREYQETAVSTVTASRYGVLESKTGSGKTVMAIAITEKHQQKTLFIVHTKALLNQTIAAADTFLGIKAGTIGGGKKDIKDFTVATIQSLQRSPPLKGTFGLILIDECHHIPSTTFSKVIMQLDSHYMYGLSATPSRPDGLTWALTATVGPFLHTVPKKDLLATKSVIKPIVISVDTPYNPSKVYDQFDLSAHLEDIAKSDLRNTFIANHFDRVYLANNKLSAVILTERTAHAEELAKKLKHHKPILLHGKLPEKIKTANLDAVKKGEGYLTIATYSFVGEGFDIPGWDTLFLGSPFSSSIRLIQVLGRISRPSEGKDVAYVYDYVDRADPVLYNRYLKRLEEYGSI